jgi:hypothetical protein
VSGEGTASLALGSVSAAPGAHVEVPLNLVTSTNLAGSGVRDYEARVRYRASALAPAGTTPMGAIDGSDRVLSVSGSLPAGMVSGELARMEFIAALGDSQTIAMRLEKVTWRDAGGAERNVATTLQGGTFELIGFCTTGGTRLVTTGGTAGLKAIVPNPSGGEVRVDYELLEDGASRLVVIDLLGREVAHVADEHAPGAHSATFDASALESGTYMLVLETPGGRETSLLQVMK